MRSDPYPSARREEHILSLLSSADRPLSDIVADFLERFPVETRHLANAFISVALEEKWIEPKDRFVAFAILHQSFTSNPETFRLSFLLKAFSDEKSSNIEHAFIQLLLTSTREEMEEMLKRTATDYCDTPRLNSMNLLPKENVEKRALTRDQALARLERLCSLLAINYNSMVKQFGVDGNDVEKAITMVSMLEGTAKENYDKLKSLSRDLLYEWICANVPYEKTTAFYWMLGIHDSDSIDEILGHKFLATSAVKTVVEKVKVLETARKKEVKLRYLARVKQLAKLLKETHLSGDIYDFHPTELVAENEYKVEKKRLKGIISDVKSVSKERKNMVLRVETVRTAVKLKLSLEEVQVLYMKATKAAEELERQSIPYDN